MASRERISLTGLPNESLDRRFFPDNPESPTLAHLHVVNSVANGLLISEDVRESVLITSIRYRENLEKTIDKWNALEETLRNTPSLRQIALQGVMAILAVSYGPLYVSPQERVTLINGALANLSRNISVN